MLMLHGFPEVWTIDNSKNYSFTKVSKYGSHSESTKKLIQILYLTTNPKYSWKNSSNSINPAFS